jgi:ribA/ribD-fused uncharacterized protein
MSTETITHFHGAYRFLSNFYPCPISFDGMMYPTVEHAFQAAKTESYLVREMIRDCPTPGTAKRMGGNKKLFIIRPHWDEMRLGTMLSLLRKKFSLRSFKERLISTGDRQLVEGNWWRDTYWGVDDETGLGENHLGKLLMQVREELKK